MKHTFKIIKCNYQYTRSTSLPRYVATCSVCLWSSFGHEDPKFAFMSGVGHIRFPENRYEKLR